MPEQQEDGLGGPGDGRVGGRTGCGAVAREDPPAALGPAASARAAGSGAVRPSRTWRGNITVTTSSMPSRASAGSTGRSPRRRARAGRSRAPGGGTRTRRRAARQPKVQQGAAGSVARSVSTSDPAPSRNQPTSWSRSTGASSNVFWPERPSTTAVRAQRWTPPRWWARSVSVQPGTGRDTARRDRRSEACGEGVRRPAEMGQVVVRGQRCEGHAAVCGTGRPMSAVRRRRPPACPAAPARARTA